jgi:hypothetical protein
MHAAQDQGDHASDDGRPLFPPRRHLMMIVFMVVPRIVRYENSMITDSPAYVLVYKIGPLTCPIRMHPIGCTSTRGS